MSVFSLATRKKAKLRLALTGVSGAGKTMGALLIAYGMTGDWNKVALIDTEHERALFYADKKEFGIGKFLWASLMPPYSPERYKAFVADAAGEVGANGVVIVDSFSHAWINEGGVLEIKDKIAERPGKNSYTAWNEAGREQSSLVNSILSANCHMIITMRSKMEYIMQENERGKMMPVKVGLAPIQRDDTEYEFDTVLNIDRNHIAAASKDTTFLDRFNGPLTVELGQQLAAWLGEGEEPERCEICGKTITATKNYSVKQIIEKTREQTGKQMCKPCHNEWFKRNNDAAAT